MATLDDFVNIWDEHIKAQSCSQAHKQNPHNPSVYEQVYDATERYPGRNMRPQPGQPDINPKEIGVLISQWFTNSQRIALNYTNANLENILENTDGKKLRASVFALKPYNMRNSAHDKIAKLQKEVTELNEIIHLYRSDKPEEQQEALRNIYSSDGIKKIIGECLKEKDEQDGLSEEESKEFGAQSWLNSLLYVAERAPQLAVNLFEETAVQKQKEMFSELDSYGLTRYIAENVSRAKDDEKLRFYKALHSMNREAA